VRILLTGASGFLGKILEQTLTDSGIDIIGLGRNHSQINSDLSISTPVLPKIDLVIHTAGKAHSVPKTEEEKEAFYNVNVNGTLNLLKGLEHSVSLPRSFVFISSVAVYGKETRKAIDENTPLLAIDAYGQSKIEAEQIIQDWCKKNNVICAILRLPLIAGINPPGNLKAMIQGIQKGYYFNIAGGKARKSMVLAEDVARIIPRSAEIGGVYNLTDGYHPSFSELSLSIANQYGKRKPYNIPQWLAKLMAKTGDIIGTKSLINSDKLRKITSDLTFDDSKARRELGWNPTPVLEGFKIM
jgi:nucleoside-diphosphate-sugar epimerase